MENISRSLEGAWRAGLQALDERGRAVDGVRDPDSVGSRFGTRIRPTVEIEGYELRISNPRARHFASDVRAVNRRACAALFFWALSGSSLLEDIALYNERASSFTDDGKTVPSALGPVLFPANGEAGLDAVVDILKRDPCSRRAFLPLGFRAPVLKSRDVSCFDSISFRIREGRLNALGVMRSQSALMVLPYDLYFLTMIQELVASELDVALGCYTHYCHSFHVYRDEMSLMQDVLDEPYSLMASPMPVMPAGTLALRGELVGIERCLRSASPDFESELIGFSRAQRDYWRPILQLLSPGV